MNEIQRALHDIAQQEIPDDMKSLWPELQAQLSTDRPRSVRSARRFAWGSLMVTLSLVISVAAYAFYQDGRQRDPGLNWVQENDLITPINQSVSLDGITVTLDWAYADANRIALAYTATREDTGDNLGFTVDGPNRASCLFESTIGEISGPMIIYSPSDPFFLEADEIYDAALIQDDPETLNLRYQLWLGISPIPSTPTPAGNLAVAGGGSGDSGGGGFRECGDPVWLQQIDGNPVGPFIFEFSVPFIAAQVITMEQDVTANEITMTLQQVAYTPSMTSVQLCFDQPDNGNYWTALGALDTGQQEIGLSAAFGAYDRKCTLLQFPAPYDRQPARWTLTVTHLEMLLDVTPDNVEKVKSLSAKYGLTIEVEWQAADIVAWGISAPEGTDIGSAMQALQKELGLWVDGPWTFSLDVPGS